jgi:hypothetical protein
MAELLASTSHIWDFGNPRVQSVFCRVQTKKTIDEKG